MRPIDVDALLRQFYALTDLPEPQAELSEWRLVVGDFDVDVVHLMERAPAVLQLRVDVGPLSERSEPALCRQLLRLNLLNTVQAWGVLALDGDTDRLLILHDIPLNEHSTAHTLVHALRYTLGQARYLQGLIEPVPECAA